MSLYDRRVEDRGKSITSMIRLVIEIVAVVWAVSGLNAATNNLRETVSNLNTVVNGAMKIINDHEVRIRMLEGAKKEK